MSQIFQSLMRAVDSSPVDGKRMSAFCDKCGNLLDTADLQALACPRCGVFEVPEEEIRFGVTTDPVIEAIDRMFPAGVPTDPQCCCFTPPAQGFCVGCVVHRANPHRHDHREAEAPESPKTTERQK